MDESKAQTIINLLLLIGQLQSISVLIDPAESFLQRPGGHCAEQARRIGLGAIRWKQSVLVTVIYIWAVPNPPWGKRKCLWHAAHFLTHPYYNHSLIPFEVKYINKASRSIYYIVGSISIVHHHIVQTSYYMYIVYTSCTTATDTEAWISMMSCYNLGPSACYPHL